MSDGFNQPELDNVPEGLNILNIVSVGKDPEISELEILNF